jgi:hypothetical protein
LLSDKIVLGALFWRILKRRRLMRSIWLAAALAVGLTVGRVVVSHAQSPQAAEGISSTDLVKEIHLIRAFLEASHKDNARLEVLLNRYRLQHDTVASISDRLEYIRDELATVDNDIAAASTKAGDFQVSSNAVSSTDAEVKPQLESQLNDSQAVLQDLKSRQTRLLAQQSRLSSALNTEQNRVRVLEDALDAIAPTR